MRVREAFETSEKLAAEGRECSIEFGGKVIARVWVRPADVSLNADYRRELAEITIGLRSGEEIDEETDRENLYRVFFRSVITKIEWMDPADKKDPKLKFTEDNMVALFSQAPKFFEGIQRGARNWGNYRAAHEGDATGN